MPHPVMIANYPPRVEYKRDIRPKDIGLTVPDDGFRYGVIRHVRELEKGDPIPAVYQSGLYRYQERDYDYLPLPFDWQWHIYHLLEWASEGLIPKGGIIGYYEKGGLPFAIAEGLTWAYVNLVERHRAFTDSKPPEAGYRDYVTGRNSNEEPYEWLCRTTTGNLVKIIGNWGIYYEVEAYDIRRSPSDYNYAPHLVHWATEISSTGIVARFPQLKVLCRRYGFTEVGTPIPFLSKGGVVRLPKEHIRILQPGQAYSPYEGD